MKKESCLTLTVCLLLLLTACSNHQITDSGTQSITEQDPTASTADGDAFDAEREGLQQLYGSPTVAKASITSTLSKNSPAAEQYEIDLRHASASITDHNQATKTYFLDTNQIESLCKLLSQYTLTVYDSQPYWPTGDYCTMIELFDYQVMYEGGIYREYGATHYPEGWDGFIQNLKSLIISGEEATEYTYEVIARVREGMPEYRYAATGIASGTDDWSMGYITGLKVLDEHGQSILSLGFTSEGNGNPIFFHMMDTMGLHVVDVNFDGYRDVILLNSYAGAHSNTWYDCWLWDAENSGFVYCKSFSEICNPAVSQENQCIYSSGGSGAGIHCYEIYRYINHEFKLASRLYWEHKIVVESSGVEEDGLKEMDGTYLKEERLVDGKMETIHDGFFPGETADGLIGPYRSGEPWQLDSPRWYMSGGHHADVWLE